MSISTELSVLVGRGTEVEASKSPQELPRTKNICIINTVLYLVPGAQY